ncbi:MAG: hypothetical protein PHC61_15255 [Chitinivibrionales bacterium]|nr:hypothetical protein [Chitinivibrionales bacterium]
MIKRFVLLVLLAGIACSIFSQTSIGALFNFSVNSTTPPDNKTSTTDFSPSFMFFYQF